MENGKRDLEKAQFKFNRAGISINMSYRIVIELIIKDDERIFVDIGDHDKVY